MKINLVTDGRNGRSRHKGKPKRRQNGHKRAQKAQKKTEDKENAEDFLTG
jgi:hypothetical protein